PRLRELVLSLDPVPTLSDTARFSQTLLPEIDGALGHEPNAWLSQLRAALHLTTERAQARLDSLRELATCSLELSHPEFGFLYDPQRHLLSIGYNASEHRLDASFYDLLASEARLASFVAIAQGQLPQEHWFALGRQLCILAGQPVLLSWSGSMFEYLMPLLVMPNYPSTLLDQTYHSVIAAQIEYGRQR